MRRRRAALLLPVLLLAACSGADRDTASGAGAGAAAGAGSAPATSSAPSRPSSAPAPSTSPAAPAGPRGGPVPTRFAPLSVSFVSDSTGFALGGTGCGKPRCTAVVRTRDAGRTWDGIPAPRTVVADPVEGVSELRFGSPSDGWAFGHELWSTHDGGATWAEVPAARYLARGPGVLEAAAGTAWLVTDGCENVEGTCTGRAQLLRSPVGRDDWAAVDVPLGTTADLVLHGSAVYVVSQAPKSAPVLVASADGRRFSRRSLPCREDTRPLLAASGDLALALLCPGADGEAPGRSRASAFVSSDGGQHWKRVGDPPVTPFGSSLSATGSGTFLAAPGSGVYVTRDGSRSWQQVVRPVGRDQGGPTYVGFVTDSFGVTLAPVGGGAAGMGLTRDGGRRWQRVGF